ncbi:MAG: hypothetical protein ACC707_12290 [Thiohalomonadales bacterium]
MLDILTYMVGGVSVLAVILLIILMANIYNADHPLNQNRTDQD